MAEGIALAEKKLTLPEPLKRILATLKEAGFEAYAVGGCVRDALLDRTPEDWDVTTSAKPEEVKALFPRTVDTGLKHGTVTVLSGKTGFEVTTYRIDGCYGDARHPDHVVFSTSLEEDLKRRDFTINAMAYGEEEGLIDLHGGVADLENGLLRAVGEPSRRFSEDALRMLRGVRFSAQLGFVLEEETRAAIPPLAERLSLVSPERIQAELKKLLLGDFPERLGVACELGLTKVFLPEFDRCMETPQNNPHHSYNVGMHILRALKAAALAEALFRHFPKGEKLELPPGMGLKPPQILQARLAILLHDIAKPLCRTTDAEGIDHFHGHAKEGERLAGKILRRLKFDNKTVEKVKLLVANHEIRTPMTDRELRRLMARAGDENMEMLLEVLRADILAQSDYMREEKLKGLSDITGRICGIRLSGDAVRIKDLKITGSDLIAIGVPEGRLIGKILQELLEQIMDAPELNSRQYLLEAAKQLWKKYGEAEKN